MVSGFWEHRNKQEIQEHYTHAPVLDCLFRDVSIALSSTRRCFELARPYSDVATRPCDCQPGASTSRRSIHIVCALVYLSQVRTANSTLTLRGNSHSTCPVMPCPVVSNSSHLFHRVSSPPLQQDAHPLALTCTAMPCLSITAHSPLQIGGKGSRRRTCLRRTGGLDAWCAGVVFGRACHWEGRLCDGDCVFVHGGRLDFVIGGCGCGCGCRGELMVVR